MSWPWSVKTDKEIYTTTIKWPKISIVTPSFNQGLFIEETILSVINQNYPSLEYIIIDGGSTDETIRIIKKYEPWITYWVSEPDRGQSHAINKGLEKCTGDIFNWLNSDDWYMPDTFYEIAKSFLKDPSLKVVSGFEHHIAQDGSISLHKGAFIQETLEKTIELCHISQPSTFFKLDALKQIGPISEDLHYLMDGEMWVRFLLLHGQKNFLKIEKAIVNFRFHEHSKTVNHVNDKFILERNSIIIDLQRFVGLPVEIRRFWLCAIFKAKEVYESNRKWNINPEHVTKKQLRLYFIKKFINIQFQNRNIQQASWGIYQLIKNRSFNLFLFRSIIKLAVKGSIHK